MFEKFEKAPLFITSREYLFKVVLTLMDEFMIIDFLAKITKIKRRYCQLSNTVHFYFIKPLNCKVLHCQVYSIRSIDQIGFYS